MKEEFVKHPTVFLFLAKDECAKHPIVVHPIVAKDEFAKRRMGCTRIVICDRGLSQSADIVSWLDGVGESDKRRIVDMACLVRWRRNILLVDWPLAELRLLQLGVCCRRRMPPSIGWRFGNLAVEQQRRGKMVSIVASDAGLNRGVTSSDMLSALVQRTVQFPR